MSELQQAINEMRNMRESYDQLAGAAEAYNTGKAELAANINAKGVEAGATETLPALAKKVAAIAQETYEINGGEMYAKQLFGSLETPNYWNLYEVLAQLLSDGRLVQYGGILLAEYYRGYDSLALAGAGAGGAYVVSDLDENGQFKMYTEDTTHTWATEFDGKGNRWVAYCFADEYHDFQITDTNTSPRSIFIGRKVGTITNLVNSRCSKYEVPDNSELYSINNGDDGYSVKVTKWDKNVTLRNITRPRQFTFYGDSTGITEKVYLSCKELNYSSGGCIVTNTNSILNSVIVKSEKINLSYPVYERWNSADTSISSIVIDCPDIINNNRSSALISSVGGNPSKLNIYFLNTESMTGNGFTFRNCFIQNLYIGYYSNNREKSVSFNATGSFSLLNAKLQEGWLKPLDIANITAQLSAESIALNILDRLGDNTGQSTLTLKIGATALATIQNSEEYSSYLTDAIDNKNWNVIA